MMKGEWKRSVKHVKQPRNPRRLVVKVGTSTLTHDTGRLNLHNMDLLARTLFAPTELSISSVTAVFGAPVVIWLLVRRQTQEGRE